MSIAAVTKRADIFRSLHEFVGRHLRSDMSKISIRFFNDREVRAVWDDGAAKWWFGAVDVVAVLSGSANARNYWYVLKTG